MKKTLAVIWNILEAIGRARSAAHFARTGDLEAARNMLK